MLSRTHRWTRFRVVCLIHLQPLIQLLRRCCEFGQDVASQVPLEYDEELLIRRLCTSVSRGGSCAHELSAFMRCLPCSAESESGRARARTSDSQPSSTSSTTADDGAAESYLLTNPTIAPVILSDKYCYPRFSDASHLAQRRLSRDLLILLVCPFPPSLSLPPLSFTTSLSVYDRHVQLW